ncbi:MAG: hypothetical protein K6T16_01050 [Candidatus Pacearchaeota archaeon]|nr:hypothetical protein [Candidatus Pacearchaeota archaeon]
MSLTKKIEEFFEISANVNFGSVIPYLGSAIFSFYNIIDGPNKNDYLLLAISGGSFIMGLAISGISYALYKNVSQDIESAEQLARVSNNRLIKNAVDYYKKRKAEGKEK